MDLEVYTNKVGNVVVRTKDKSIEMELDLYTGIVYNFNYLETDINRLNTFVNKAKSKYRKFVMQEGSGDLNM